MKMMTPGLKKDAYNSFHQPLNETEISLTF